ncbi:mycothiol synthase [Micromonospora sp. NPDC049559]|uniref:mycothiol synthase n=1 Tax=Micromonospora sp. NPDC049559 TaxID=3155923 RepID=UPI00342683C3
MSGAAEPVTAYENELPSGDAIREVLALLAVAADADGAEPVSEDGVLRLKHAGDTGVRHLTVRDPDGALAGYAQVETGADGTAAELVVHPLRRHRGLGAALLDAVIRDANGPVEVWAHGDHPGAAALGLDRGFRRVRELWTLRRPLGEPLPEPVLPAGVSLRAFRPGEDDEAWLEVNRRAFADHPEQGRWTREDLRARFAEPWFDPAGFLLAVEESTGRLLGFHWTKVHGAERPADATVDDRRPADATAPGIVAADAPETADRAWPIGEVYVLGVHPETHGLGLGRALTVAGLRHLRERGLRRVMLYVDESNTAAVALYRRAGFARWSTDVRYRRG